MANRIKYTLEEMTLIFNLVNMYPKEEVATSAFWQHVAADHFPNHTWISLRDKYNMCRKQFNEIGR